MTLNEHLKLLFKKTTEYRWCKRYAAMSDDMKRRLISRLEERIKIDEENKEHIRRKNLEEPFPFAGKVPNEDAKYCGGGRRIIHSTKPFS